MVGNGPIFWLLVILGAVSVITFFERFFDLRRAQIDYQDFLKGVINVLDAGNDAEALAICEDTSAPVANVVATAIRHREGSARALREAVDSQGRAEISRLDRRLATLAIISQVSPLIGLLGVVIGLVKTVRLFDVATLVTRAELMTTALGALLPAAAGLTVAILAAVLYGSLRVRLERTVVDLEAAASQIIGYLSAAREARR